MNLESALTHLECPECHKTFNADIAQTYCSECKSPLLARYDLNLVRNSLTRDEIKHRPHGMWRWAELLPVRDERFRLRLGEGDTPLLPLPRLGGNLGLPNVFLKDESMNVTASFKARGLAAAVSRAWELGVHEFVIPTAGNAGGALAAYAARAGLAAHVYMPADTPLPNQLETRAFGADVHLVDGLISDAAKQASFEAAQHGWFDVSTFKEPYRCEGKKTLGLELAEQFDWQLPDVIIYPTGGGTGLVGMWKAFAELEALGWIDSYRPRMVSVQAAGCAPIVRAFEAGAERAEFWQGAQTLASGLRVPGAFADRLILRALRDSHGTALSVSDDDILTCQREMGASEGIFAAPEGAATYAALKQLQLSGWLNHNDRIVLFNTASGLKYV